jgi:hypothetical protein
MDGVGGMAADAAGWERSFAGALAAAGVRGDLLAPSIHAQFDRDGYAILRRALPDRWIEPLRDIFERSIPEAWTFPRERGTRFSMVENDPLVRRACLLPPLLATVAAIMDRRFYFAGVQGRDPMRGGGAQRLHRDYLIARRPTCIVSGFAFLDDFDAANGATRVVPGTHRSALGTQERVLSGAAGDILLLDARVIHSATRNVSGRKRRSLHMTFRAHELFASSGDEWDLSGASPLDRRLMGSDT